MSEPLSIIEVLVCPNCFGHLKEDLEKALKCQSCGFLFHVNPFGYYDLLLNNSIWQIDSTTVEYAHIQEAVGLRFYNEFLRPLLLVEPFERVLDAGCGMGVGISELARAGYEAYGIDLPHLSRFWSHADNPPKNFFCCDAIQLPFRTDYFDVVYSLGVIEHIGTIDGNEELIEDYWNARTAYADSLLRVTRPGGRIFISCPNKSFPLDIQHPARGRIGKSIYKKLGVNVHRTWGKYHLLSYAEVRWLFCDRGTARSFKPLPLKGYFSFSGFGYGFLKPLKGIVTFYINNLTRFLRSSFLNPYMLVQIRK